MEIRRDSWGGVEIWREELEDWIRGFCNRIWKERDGQRNGRKG